MSSCPTPLFLRRAAGVFCSCSLNMAPVRELSSDTRAQIIGLHEAGHQTGEISRLVGASKATVKRWVARYKKENSGETPRPLPRSGRPRKTSPRAINVVKRAIESNVRITARKLKETNPLVFTDVSVRTVSRRVHELGYTSHKPVKKPLLTKPQRARRVAFADKYLTWDEEDWLNVLWSDEATFTVTCNRGGAVYRKKGSDPLDSRYVEHTVKHPDSLMVWGAFSGKGLGKLVVLPKNVRVNRWVYLDLLLDHLGECLDLTGATVFQQDGARPHTAHIVTEYLNEGHVPFISDWPGNSPDINPIENLWHIVKRDLQGKDVSSVPKLEQEIRKSWANIPVETCRNLALSLPRRLKAVKKHRGRPTKY